MTCSGCGQDLNKLQHFLACFRTCSREFHPKCTNLSKAQLRFLDAVRNIRWTCNDCLENCKSAQKPNCVAAFNKFTNNYLLRASLVLLVISILVSLLIIFRTCATTSTLPLPHLTPLTVLDAARLHNESMELKMITRKGWRAEAPIGPLPPLKLPVASVILSSTGSSSCDSYATCRRLMALEQSYTSSTWKTPDIIHNFYIDVNGYVYVGRGWDTQTVEPKDEFLRQSDIIEDAVSVAFLSKLSYDNAAAQLAAIKALLEEGERSGKLSTDYKIYMTSNEFRRQFLIERTFEHWTRWAGEFNITKNANDS